MALIKKSLAVLNSSLLFVLAAYFLDVVFQRWVYLNLSVFAIVFVIPLKIFVLGGIYGMLIELVSGEEIVLKFSRFGMNARKYWKYYLCITALPCFIYLSFIISGSKILNMNISSFFAFINPILLFILASAIIQNKYIKPSKLKKKNIRIDLPSIAIMFGLFISGLFIFHLPHIMNIKHLHLSRITDFCYIYIYFLIFIYFAYLIVEQYPEIQKTFLHEREIYLINPLGGGFAFYLSSLYLRKYPPFFIAIKALTPKEYKFREFNNVPWKDRHYASGKLVAITCFTSNCMDAYHMAREFKKRGSTVILGGPHVTYFPDEALEYCDSVVCGELESVWPDVIKDYEHNTLQKKYLGVPLDNCHQLVHQELLNSPPGIIKDFLETSRGCKFKCYFCTVPSLSQGTFRKKSISDLIDLIKIVKTKYNDLVFIDNNIYGDPAHTKELFEALKPMHIKWSSAASIDMAKNKKVLELAKESGCKLILFGFEISEGSFEKKQGGKFAMVDRYQEFAKEIKRMGIKIKAHFIFGFVSDRFAHLYKIWKFCCTMKPHVTALSILTPYPGSQFYYDMIKQDRISNLNWRHYGGLTLVFHHPLMNNFVLSKLYPMIYLLFLLTTSKSGYILSLFIIIFIAVIV